MQALDPPAPMVPLLGLSLPPLPSAQGREAPSLTARTPLLPVPDPISSYFAPT